MTLRLRADTSAGTRRSPAANAPLEQRARVRSPSPPACLAAGQAHRARAPLPPLQSPGELCLKSRTAPGYQGNPRARATSASRCSHRAASPSKACRVRRPDARSRYRRRSPGRARDDRRTVGEVRDLRAEIHDRAARCEALHLPSPVLLQAHEAHPPPPTVARAWRARAASGANRWHGHSGPSTSPTRRPAVGKRAAQRLISSPCAAR